MRWAISGGAGFLGLHLARRLLADGHEVRTLDLAPLDEPELEQQVDELRGDVRDRHGTRRRSSPGRTCSCTRRLRCPFRRPARRSRSVNVAGTATLLAAAAEAAVRRVVLVSSTAVYGIPNVHPIHEDDSARRGGLVRGVEDRSGGGDPRLRPARARVRDRPARRRSSARSGSACSRSSSTGSATAGGSTCSATARTATSCSRSRTSSTRSCSRPSGPRRPGRP